MAMVPDNWAVRGMLNSELGGHKRFKYGEERVAVRLDTRTISVLATLQANGRLHLRLGVPGMVGTKAVLDGRIDVVDGQLTFTPSIPELGLTRGTL